MPKSPLDKWRDAHLVELRLKYAGMRVALHVDGGVVAASAKGYDDLIRQLEEKDPGYKDHVVIECIPKSQEMLAGEREAREQKQAEQLAAVERLGTVERALSLSQSAVLSLQDQVTALRLRAEAAENNVTVEHRITLEWMSRAKVAEKQLTAAHDREGTIQNALHNAENVLEHLLKNHHGKREADFGTVLGFGSDWLPEVLEEIRSARASTGEGWIHPNLVEGARKAFEKCFQQLQDQQAMADDSHFQEYLVALLALGSNLAAAKLRNR